MSDLNLVAAELSPHSSISHTYRRDDGCVTSWIDYMYILCDPALCPDLSLFNSSDFGSNLSDHLPLSCMLHVDIFCAPSSHASQSTSAHSTNHRIAWHAGSSDQLESYCDLVSS